MSLFYARVAGSATGNSTRHAWKDGEPLCRFGNVRKLGPNRRQYAKPFGKTCKRCQQNLGAA